MTKGKKTAAKAAKGSKKEGATAKANGAVNGHKRAAPLVAQSAGGAVLTVDLLDEKVKEIKKIFTDGAVSMHRLGVVALEVQETQLCKQLLTPKGVPAYRTFSEFCQAELGNSARHVYRAIEIAQNFTVAQLTGMSGRQVRLALEVPKEHRQEIIEAAKSGTRTKALSEKANKLRGKLPAGKAPKNDGKPEKGLIAVGLQAGHQRIKMYARPKEGNQRAIETENAKPAKKLGDFPWAVLECRGNTKVVFRIVPGKDGQLLLDIETRKGPPAV